MTAPTLSPSPPLPCTGCRNYHLTQADRLKAHPEAASMMRGDLEPIRLRPAQPDAAALHQGVKTDIVRIGKLIAALRGCTGSPISEGRLEAMAYLAMQIAATADQALERIRERPS